ncbi:nucleoside phosphorylase [Actinomadura viridis]|uniref:Uridine phosphorylase n=1 Tax=Actinomadura viridis TaxID=58110 RepID=A0A931DJW5_9ACTN|nr:nucleoside phosphorylase [Actinomadura viridis]MBG6091375.1 uridine phosphorylase [Actinomadura viridis]
MDLPLTEFDMAQEAVLTPTPPRLSEPLPERVVMCFFPEVVAGLPDSHGGRQIGEFSIEMGGHKIYRVTHDETLVAVFHPGVGAPLAAHHFEKAIAAGGRVFVACGGAGALRPGTDMGYLVVPDAAVRDEGTSYHYAPAAPIIHADPGLVEAATTVLLDRGIPFTTGTTWTTDAPFRETRARVQTRQRQGCVTVEMETAAFLAVAQFRGVKFCQYLYAGDDLSGPAWDHRDWTTAEVRTELLHIAIEATGRL